MESSDVVIGIITIIISSSSLAMWWSPQLFMKCIFLYFGAVLKRMVKLAKHHSKKLKQKLSCKIHMKFIYIFTIYLLFTLFTKKKYLKSPPSSSSSSCPIPSSHPSSPFLLSSPSCPPCFLIFPTNKNLIWVTKHSLQRNILNSFFRDSLFDRRLWKHECKAIWTP